MASSSNISSEAQIAQCSSNNPSSAEQKCEYTLRLYDFPEACSREIVMALQTLTRHKISLADMVAGRADEKNKNETKTKECVKHHHKNEVLYKEYASHLAAVARVGENFVDYEYHAVFELSVEEFQEHLVYIGTDAQVEERPSEQPNTKVIRLIGVSNDVESVEESIEQARLELVTWLGVSEMSLMKTEQQRVQAMPTNKEGDQ